MDVVRYSPNFMRDGEVTRRTSSARFEKDPSRIVRSMFSFGFLKHTKRKRDVVRGANKDTVAVRKLSVEGARDCQTSVLFELDRG